MKPTAPAIAPPPLRLAAKAARQRPPAAALDTVLAAMQHKLYAIAYAATGEREDALDLVQVAMTQLVAHYRQRPAEEWPPLLMRILTNAITDHYRRTARQRESMDNSCDLSELCDTRQQPATDQNDNNPAAAASAAQLNRAIAGAVAALPERQRLAFLLRGWAELNVAECAQAMACSVGSVKQHYFRALRSLRSALGAQPAPLTSTTDPKEARDER